MNILYINKFFHIEGGVDRYFFNLSKLMEEKGHKIAFFSTNSDNDNKSVWKKYFVSYIPFENKSILSKLKFLFRIFYCREARSKVSKLLDEFKPDIVHIHSIYHQLSPSILPEIKKRKIPIIQNLGDFHLVSPNYNLFHSGQICEITKPANYYKAIFHKCVKNSYFASLVEATEKYIHRLIGWERNCIDLFIVPSLFMKTKLMEYGLNQSKIRVIAHFTENKLIKQTYNGDYILYFGRLSEEKGLRFLVRVLQNLPEINLKIAGRGPEKKILQQLIRDLKLKNVELLGFKDGQDLKKLISGCRFTILPSLWSEVFGLSIIESFCLGKPVIASYIGGIPEIVKEKYNGMLFMPGNSRELSDKITTLWENKVLCNRFGDNARKTFEEKYTPEFHYRQILSIYKSLTE